MTSPVNVTAITVGLRAPAARVRIRQYIPSLASQGILVREYIPFFHESCGLPSPFKALSQIRGVVASRRTDLTWIGRELVRGYITFEPFLKRPCVMDVDDAIWMDRPFGWFALPRIAHRMDAIVAGNAYLADWFSRYCRAVHVLPTAIDLDRYCKRPDSTLYSKERFTIGWTGLASNYKFLELIETPLLCFLNGHSNAELLLVAERPWRPKYIPAHRIRFVPWSPQTEATSLQDMSVGVMPLPDNEWTRGKCGFKMLQYMAVGIPVVVSPVGMNKEVLAKGQVGLAATTDDEWYQALETLHADQALQVRMGDTARQVIEQHFSAAVVAGSLASLFRSLMSK